MSTRPREMEYSPHLNNIASKSGQQEKADHSSGATHCSSSSRTRFPAAPALTVAICLVLVLPVLSSTLHLLSRPPLGLLPLSHPSNSSAGKMSWFQKEFTLTSKARGSYLVTDHVLSSLPEIRAYKTGILHLFVRHTSCALSLNENWDADVREDMSDAMDRIVPYSGPKGEELYRHNAEGPDDMPAHVKSALVGASVTIPIKDGKLLTGTWQGIWYLEFRAHRHTRSVVATIQGEKKS